MHVQAADFFSRHPELSLQALGASANGEALDLKPAGIPVKFLPAEHQGVRQQVLFGEVAHGKHRDDRIFAVRAGQQRVDGLTARRTPAFGDLHYREEVGLPARREREDPPLRACDEEPLDDPEQLLGIAWRAEAG